MNYLLDTNVVSELRRTKPHGAVLAWLAQVKPDSVWLSAVTLGELQAGVENIRQQDVGRAADIEAWVDRVAQSYSIIPVTGPVFRLWAKLMHGRTDALIQDALIAATAITHGMIVVSRKFRDFDQFGLSAYNPFEFGR